MEPTRDDQTVYGQLKLYTPASWDYTQVFGTKCSVAPGAEQKPRHDISQLVGVLPKQAV